LVAVREEEEEVAAGVEGAAAPAPAEGRGSGRLREARHPRTTASLLLTDGKLCKKAVATVLCEVQGCRRSRGGYVA
jgi:hypothetical protein